VLAARRHGLKTESFPKRSLRNAAVTHRFEPSLTLGSGSSGAPGDRKMRPTMTPFSSTL